MFCILIFARLESFSGKLKHFSLSCRWPWTCTSRQRREQKEYLRWLWKDCNKIGRLKKACDGNITINFLKQKIHVRQFVCLFFKVVARFFDILYAISPFQERWQPWFPLFLLFQRMDINADGKVTRREFVRCCLEDQKLIELLTPHTAWKQKRETDRMVGKWQRSFFFFFFNLGSSLSFSGKVRVVKERKEKLVDEILRVLVLFSPPPFFSLFYWWSVTKWWGRRKREENFEKKEVGWEEIFRFVARRSPDFYPRIFEKKCRPPKRFFFFENPLSRALKIFWCSKKFYLYFVSLPLDTKKIKISFEIPAPPQKKSY